MARCLAVAMSHERGLSGIPASGHCSSAMTSASCARSSASPTSPTIRASPAMSLADSIRQTASMASAALGGVAIHHLSDFDFQLLLPEADVRLQKAPRPVDGFGLRRDVVDRIPADDFLGLGERSVGDGDLAVREPGARPLGGRAQSPHAHHLALLRRFRAELADL